MQVHFCDDSADWSRGRPCCGAEFRAQGGAAAMKILSAAEMREVDKLTTARYGIPGLTLMENAGASVAEFIAQCWPSFAQRRIVVLCGKGNNGGDGFVVARRLRELGAKPQVYVFATPEEMQGDAATNCKRWQE